MAMPTSAAASAGSVVDAVADLGDVEALPLQLADDPQLVLGQKFSARLDAELLADRRGVR
jgi:hypothetical protein